MNDKVAFLEKLTGHKFKDKKRLLQAITHSSVNNIKQKDYERLEFLGDRVLGLLISEMLCAFFPQATEGELSVRLNSLVSAQTCAQIAIDSKLYEVIVMGPDMKHFEKERLFNIYADVVEAVIAVIYLEAGLSAVRPFIKTYWEKRARSSQGARPDAKTYLQEWAHQQNGSQPLYRLLKRSGPDHEPVFKVEVRIAGYAPAVGEGRSKRMAERSAAQLLLEREEVWVKTEENLS